MNKGGPPAARHIVERDMQNQPRPGLRPARRGRHKIFIFAIPFQTRLSNDSETRKLQAYP